MKKNLQEAEYREITGLDIRGQLLENAGTPEDRGDGKPFLMHKLRVMIGPYQKDIPITNQELKKIMFIQENKKMTLKEMIKKELAEMLQEENINTESATGRNPAAYGKGGPDISGASKRFKGVIGDIDDNISEALRLAKEVRDELLPNDPYERNRDKAGPYIQAAIEALLDASNVYRL